MRTSVTTFDERARQRFDNLAWHAAYHARGVDVCHVERVVTAVRMGAIAIRDGHACLAALRAQQQRAA